MKLIHIYINLFLIVLSFEELNQTISMLDKVDKELLQCMKTSIDSCKNIKISPEKEVECCRISLKYFGYNANLMNKYTKPLCSIYTNKIQSKEDVEIFELFYKSTNAILYLLDSDIIDYSYSYTTTYDCSSQNVTLFYSLNITDEEKEIMKNENYCQRLYYHGLVDLDKGLGKTNNLEKKNLKKEDCFNALILPDSEKYLTCAYVSINFTLKNGSVIPAQTCALATKRAFINKNIDSYLNKESFITANDTLNEVFIDSYEMEIINKYDNNKLSYKYSLKSESETQTEVAKLSEEINLPQKNNTSTSNVSSSNGNFIKFFNIILLISLGSQ